MTLASTPTSRWAVSARTSGEVLAAGISRSELELVVLGVPSGFSPLEIEGWLHDLAGVAVETSKADSRSRAIPALLHHALTGLLFSHAELWDRIEPPRPCSCAFVDTPDGASFGWVGEGTVHVLVDGDPVEPQWVRVRDEAGREARAAVFAPGSEVVVTLQYWQGDDEQGPPAASVEAEWLTSVSETPAAVAAAPVPVAEPVAPLASAAWDDPLAAREERTLEPLPASLTQDQPGLAFSPVLPPAEPAWTEPLAMESPRAEGNAAPEAVEAVMDVPAAERTESAAASGAVTPDAPFEAFAPESPAAARPLFESASAPAPPAPPVEPEAPRAPHPVARWLARVMRWGQRPAAKPEPVNEVDEGRESGAPVSAYDSLLSESVPPTSVESAESHQTALELPPPVPPALEEPAGTAALIAEEAAAPQAATPAPAPGTLRAAGFAEIFGAAPSPPAEAIAPAAEAPPAPSVPAWHRPTSEPAVNDRLHALLREIEAAEAASMPVLSPEVPPRDDDEPIEVDHEPVGADESFGIPPLPAALAQPQPAEPEPAPAIPQLPPSLSVPLAEPPAPQPLAIERSAERERPREPEAPAPLAAAAILAQPSPPIAHVVEPPAASEPPAPVEPPAPAPPVAEPTPAVTPTASAPAPPAPPARAPEIVRQVPAAGDAPPMLKVSLPVAPVAEPEAAAGETAVPVEPPAFEPAPRAPRTFDTTPEPRRQWNLSQVFTDAAKQPWFRRPQVWAAGVVLVFLAGWLVGGLANPGADRGGPVMAALRAVGIGAAHFTANIATRPSGAQIEIDGKPQATRTPATLELPPGDHTVKLLLPGLGAVTVPLKGKNGEKLSVDESLHGSLEVLDPDASVPISVSVDGKAVGYAPVRLEDVDPGLHEVHFTGPGMPAFAQTVQVDIRGTAQVVARPMSAPANGVIQAQATLNDERGATPLPGAQVYVDGELRGVTPLTVELPRGPHSLRVTWHGETAPVQVIDLPGGNQRYAAFNFGLDAPEVNVALVGSPRTFAADQPKVVSATLNGLTANEVTEAWLRARSPEGLWRRYPMTMLRGPGAPVVTGVFPDEAFDAKAPTRWYVSLATKQGDEYFSEIQSSSVVGRPARPKP